MFNLVCDVQFAQNRHEDHIREAEQRRLLCLLQPEQRNLLTKLQSRLENWAITTIQPTHNHIRRPESKHKHVLSK